MGEGQPNEKTPYYKDIASVLKNSPFWNKVSESLYERLLPLDFNSKLLEMIEIPPNSKYAKFVYSNGQNRLLAQYHWNERVYERKIVVCGNYMIQSDGNDKHLQIGIPDGNCRRIFKLPYYLFGNELLATIKNDGLSFLSEENQKTNEDEGLNFIKIV